LGSSNSTLNHLGSLLQLLKPSVKGLEHKKAKETKKQKKMPSPSVHTKCFHRGVIAKEQQELKCAYTFVQ